MMATHGSRSAKSVRGSRGVRKNMDEVLSGQVADWPSFASEQRPSVMPKHREVVRVGLVPRMRVAIKQDEHHFGEEAVERVARKHEHRSADEREGHRE